MLCLNLTRKTTSLRHPRSQDIANLVLKSHMWTVQFFDAEVQSALAALPRDVRASFERIVLLIQSFGLERVREPYLKHLEGPVWEMRLKGRAGIARAAYVVATGRRVVVVHIFVKTSQKTPRRDIEAALRRAKEVK